jgi:quinol monooxygenase YgiN
VITILFSMTVKPDREDDWQALLGELTRSTHAQDDGCLAYAYYRRSDDPHEYVLFEQWRDADALGAHLARLRREYCSPPASGGALPATFLDHFKRTAAVRYEPAN